MVSDRANPVLSVIIPSYHPGETLAACLCSLQGQATSQSFEVILVDSSGDAAPALVRERFPWVKVLAFPERKYPGEARNLGIAQARGEIIAFLDADCTADRGWVEEILKVHRAGHPVVSGAVENGSRESLVGWAYYFAEFSQWMPGGSRGLVRDIAGCCLSIDRAVFRKCGPFLEGTYCSDTAFQWRIGREGIRAHFFPSIRVAHHLTGCGVGAFLAHEVLHGRSFANVRVREEAISGWRRAALLLAAPLLPFVLFGRIFARVMRTGKLVSRFLAASPLVLLGVAAWSWGEFLGYLGGAQGKGDPVARGEASAIGFGRTQGE